MALITSKLKKIDSNHKHKFDKLKTRKVLLHNESEKLMDHAATGGLTTAVDTLKQRVCICGKSETYDMERLVVGSHEVDSKAN